MEPAFLGDAMLDGEAASAEVFGAVFDSPELLGIIAGYARWNHPADLSALHRLTTTTRRNLAHAMAALQRLRLAPYCKGARVVSNAMLIVDTESNHVSLRGLAECKPDFWPALQFAFDDYPGVKILYAHGRCTWKGADFVRFLDWFTRLYPNRVLACCVGCLTPRRLYQSEWAVMSAHPAVQLGVVQLVVDVPAGIDVAHDRMMQYVAKAEKVVAAMGL